MKSQKLLKASKGVVIVAGALALAAGAMSLVSPDNILKVVQLSAPALGEDGTAGGPRAAALGEVRAVFSAVYCTLAYLMIAGILSKARDRLISAALLMGLFSIGRLASLLIDGFAMQTMMFLLVDIAIALSILIVIVIPERAAPLDAGAAAKAEKASKTAAE